MIMDDEKNISALEKKKMIEEYEKRTIKRYRFGKVAVFTIATLNIIFTILSNIIGSFNIFNIIIQISLSVALFMGVRWVRWFFVAGSVLSIGFTLYALMNLLGQGEIYIGYIIFMILSLIEAAVSGGLLAFNKGVSEFLYSQRTE